jgi:UDP-N-acetylmuramoylalanine--D-glutamate ligase
MITPKSFQNKTVAVLGLGRSGLSTTKALLSAGAHVLAWDDTEKVRLEAEKQGVSLTNLHAADWKTVDSLVLSPGIPHHFPTPHPLVSQAKEAGIHPISDLEILGLTQRDATYIAVTGTNGKSTTTALIGHILKENKVPTEIGGNIGIPALDLAPLEKNGIYVLELSSYQLELSPHFHPSVSVLLNITPDHLDRHGGMEGYIAAKQLIYKNSSAEDTIVVSLDDPHCKKIYEALEISRQVTTLPISIATFLLKGISVQKGMLFENQIPIIDLHKFEKLKGTHNWQNIAAAYGALRAVGLTPEQIITGIDTFPGLAHRQQVIGRYKNVIFVNDSKGTNAEATSKALECYKEMPLYILLGGRSKEGGISSLRSYFPFMTHAFLYGEAAQDFGNTLEGHVSYTQCATLKTATSKAAELAFSSEHSEAVVLLSPACSSFDQFQDFEERGLAFCEYVKGLEIS